MVEPDRDSDLVRRACFVAAVSASAAFPCLSCFLRYCFECGRGGGGASEHLALSDPAVTSGSVLSCQPLPAAVYSGRLSFFLQAGLSLALTSGDSIH